MQRKDSILYKVTRENEDCISELLCNLMREKYVRDIFLINLGIPQDIIQDIKFDDISTQVNLKENGKPDICINNKNILIYIENKVRIDTYLQDNQIDSYPKKIEYSNKINKYLIYLIPKGYLHSEEIDNVCNQNDFCKKIFWEDFLENVSKYEIAENNLVFRDCFRFLEDKLLSKSISIKFKPEEIIIMYNIKDLITANSYFIKLQKVIEEADIIIVEELQKVSQDFSFSDWSWDVENEKGKYLNYKKEKVIFYGLNLNLVQQPHQELSEFLLSVAIETRILDTIRIENIKQTREMFSDNEWTYLKINKYSLTDDNNSEAFAKDVVEIIKEIIL